MAFNYQSFATLGVNLNRQNYGPLDISNVFLTQADLNYYTSKGTLTEGVSKYWYESADKKVVPYPYAGQVVALVEDGNVQILKLSEKADGTFEASEVGKVPLGDGKTIEVTADGVISIKGFEGAGNGAQLTKNAKGELEWVVPSTETVDGLKTTVESIKTAVGDTNGGLVKDVDDLQAAVGVDTEGAETGIYKELADNAGAISTVSGDLATHVANKENPHGVTAAQVGLGNLTNDAQVKRSEMGVAGGVATLGEDGKVPAEQLPSYVDDVIEVENYDALPAAGEAGKIYVDKATGKTYRWGGSTYAVISDTIALGETTGTAYDGAKGKANADAINVLNGADTVEGSVAKSIKDAIEALDVEDAAVEKQFVTAVSEADGKITVSRAALTEADIPELSIAKVKDLQKALDDKADDSDVTDIDNRLKNAEQTISTLVGGEEGTSLGNLAYKSEVTKAELGSELKTEIEGKLDASAVTGDLLTHKAEEFATAAQGAKADSALQNIKVNGNVVADADVKIATGTANGHIAVNGTDVAVKGLGSAAYTEADAYATSGHKHDADYAAKATTEAHINDGDIHVTAAKKGAWDAAATKAADNEAAINTLNGDKTVAGSVDKKIDTAIAALDLANTYATKAQGTAADSALQTVTVLGHTLSKNGETAVTVDQAKTALGLKSAAYEEASAFAPAVHNHDTAYAAKSLEETVSTHIGTTNIHVTTDEKSKWNAAAAMVDELTGTDTDAGGITTMISDAVKAVQGDTESTVEAVEDRVAAIETKTALPEGTATIVEYVDNAVAGLSGAMHFIGTSTTDPTLEAGPTVADVTSYASGDVVLYGKKEYVYNGTAWIELGDETSYVVKGSIKNSDIAIDAEIDQSKINGLTDKITALENADNDLDGRLDTAEGKINTLEGKVNTLEGASHSHDNKSVLDGISAEKVAAWDAAEANAIAVDEKVILKASTYAVDAEATVGEGEYAYIITMAADDKYSIVEGTLAKIIVNGVVYVVEAAAEVKIVLDFDLEADDEIYVEFREKKTA